MKKILVCILWMNIKHQQWVGWDTPIQKGNKVHLTLLFKWQNNFDKIKSRTTALSCNRAYFSEETEEKIKLFFVFFFKRNWNFLLQLFLGKKIKFYKTILLPLQSMNNETGGCKRERASASPNKGPAHWRG